MGKIVWCKVLRLSKVNRCTEQKAFSPVEYNKRYNLCAILMKKKIENHPLNKWTC